MTNGKGLLGHGKAVMVLWLKPSDLGVRWAEIPLATEKRQQKKPVDRRCLWLSVSSGANTHDVKLLSGTFDGIVVEHPDADIAKQNLCRDAGYVCESARLQIEKRGYSPHAGRFYHRFTENQKAHPGNIIYG